MMFHHPEKQSSMAMEGTKTRDRTMKQIHRSSRHPGDIVWSKKIRGELTYHLSRGGFFRRQLRLQESFPQQKAAAKKRVESGHTSHLGQMGHNSFVATFRKDYGRYLTKHEIEYATHFGYRRLSEYIQDHPDAFEYYRETNMDEVERQTQEGRSRSSQGDHEDEDEEDQDDHDIADDDDDHDDDD
ncbi:hypothetical protein KP509_24G015600 [Ceratopteris richardii]|nr:hypothetical protein KP509_24G015600 [Ceratopteris richardii]KAH7299503.1 hypothetical protein KP509_24G015600 [Ceratopteris richardii]KAH7299504.1 hypothetical protein KP509_24G015600 [Ceratopteris richardii]KAH7299505.1 hypothetical protein KP509_24G015600 [Ceratopteris richardii]KAH7299506.1 hypothetical protein KP509_24G015600 [Ceratopteris richardii]